MSASDLKPWCHLPGNSFAAALRKQPPSAPCVISTVPCNCTFLSHCLLLSFLSPSPFCCSFSPSSGAALPRRSSRRVHFERINTVPVKGQRAARRSTRRHHSLSRTLLRYYRKPTARIRTSIRGERVHFHIYQHRTFQTVCVYRTLLLWKVLCHMTYSYWWLCCSHLSPSPKLLLKWVRGGPETRFFSFSLFRVAVWSWERGTLFRKPVLNWSWIVAPPAFCERGSISSLTNMI